MTDPTTTTRETVAIHLDPTASILGNLSVPRDPIGLVLFAHGSGSSRRSPRNRLVADVLRDGGFATLLVDLLTEDEADYDAQTRQLRFDVDRLTERLVDAADWTREQPTVGALPLGLFGASTGAAAALRCAAERPDLVRSVVSRGGRTDLADAALPAVRAATLFVVGGADPDILALNMASLAKLGADRKRVAVVDGATHLFEEPGALGRVADLSRGWYRESLG